MTLNARTTRRNRRTRRHRAWLPSLLLCAAVAALAAGGCAGDGPARTAPKDGNSAPPQDRDRPGPSDGGRTPGGGWQAEARDAVGVVDRFWQAHWNDHFTGAYASPAVRGAYTPRSADAPACAGEPAVAFNAFYCPAEDFIAWDAELLSTGYEQGDAWVYLVIAHEWGHAVQRRVQGLSVVAAELQADCLAGATLFGSEDLKFEPGDEEELAQALTALADDTPWTDSQDHGDADQRINAFSSGGNRGVGACLSA
ncbi:neutral zinc metallopeptidase [Streptomyces sp. NPDC005865]|uniref:neutral zinc metallopeptidase n=1 Tax=Streptomyces sp. NPDC005865 TaxID=3155453 RepID=UPI0033E48DFE